MQIFKSFIWRYLGAVVLARFPLLLKYFEYWITRIDFCLSSLVVGYLEYFWSRLGQERHKNTLHFIFLSLLYMFLEIFTVYNSLISLANLIAFKVVSEIL